MNVSNLLPEAAAGSKESSPRKSPARNMTGGVSAAMPNSGAAIFQQAALAAAAAQMQQLGVPAGAGGAGAASTSPGPSGSSQPQQQLVNQFASLPQYHIAPDFAPVSKYSQLLALLDELGKDVRPLYTGNKNSQERLRKGIQAARSLVRECIIENEQKKKANTQ